MKKYCITIDYLYHQSDSKTLRISNQYNELNELIEAVVAAMSENCVDNRKKKSKITVEERSPTKGWGWVEIWNNEKWRSD